jgi:hypothetical protein
VGHALFSGLLNLIVSVNIRIAVMLAALPTAGPVSFYSIIFVKVAYNNRESWALKVFQTWIATVTSSVTKGTACGPKDRGSISTRAELLFATISRTVFGPPTPPPPCSMGTGVSFPRGKRAQTVPRFSNLYPLPSRPFTLSKCGSSLLSSIRLPFEAWSSSK